MPDKLSFGYEKFFQRLTAALLAIVIAVQPGCARHHRLSEPPKPPVIPVTNFQSALGRVALVTTAQLPELQFVSAAHDKNVAASGAEGAMDGCGGGWASGCRDPATCVAAMLIGVTVCTVVVAPISAHNAKKKVEAVKAAKPSVEPMLGTDMVRYSLRKEIVAAAQEEGINLATVPPVIATTQAAEGEPQEAGGDPDYHPLAAKKVDTVLEVKLTQVFSERYIPKPNAWDSYMGGVARRSTPDLNPTLSLEMKVHVRLVKSSDNTEIFADDFVYRGKRYKYTEWANANGARLAGAMKNGYESLGRDISDRLFLLYPFADRLAKGESGNCGLAALGPKDNMAGDLAPLLSWQSFPRDSDIAIAPGDMERIKNVRYDLMLGTGGNGESPEVIYRRDGLTSTTHKVEITLNPNTRYFWSVRARFKLNGRQRVTEWATSCPFEQQLIVGARLYRFYTPKA